MALAASMFLAFPAQAEMPIKVHVKRAIDTGDPVTEASFAGNPTHLMPISQNGANTVNAISGAQIIWFTKIGSETPVEVTNFSCLVAEYELYFGRLGWEYAQPQDLRPAQAGNQFVLQYGSYNTTARPQLIVRDLAGNQTSVNNKQVAPVTLSNNTVIQPGICPKAAKFLLLDQVFSLDAGNYPRLELVGDTYGIVRRFTLKFTYDATDDNVANGIEYTYVVPPGETYSEIRVWDQIMPSDPTMEPKQSSVPLSMRFEVSNDLVNWITIPFYDLDYADPTPVTRPKTPAQFRTWFPDDRRIPGLVDPDDDGVLESNEDDKKRRFFRIKDDSEVQSVST